MLFTFLIKTIQKTLKLISYIIAPSCIGKYYSSNGDGGVHQVRGRDHEQLPIRWLREWIRY